MPDVTIKVADSAALAYEALSQIEGTIIDVDRLNSTLSVAANTDLRDLPALPDNWKVNTGGYSVPGDQGGGTFYFDPASTETDDGFIVWRPSGIDPSDPGRLIREIVNGVVTPEMAGAVGDYDPVAKTGTNNLISLQKAFNSGYEVHIPNGDYYFSGTILIENKNVYLRGGGRLFWEESGTGFDELQAIQIDGSLDVALHFLDADATELENWVDSASLAADVSPGDVVIIKSDDPFSSSPNATTNHRGEIKEVRNIVGSTVYFNTPLYDTYLTLDNAVAQIVNTVEVDLDGVSLTNIGPNTENVRGLRVNFGYKPTIRNCKFKNFRGNAAQIYNSIAFDVDEKPANGLFGNLGYGITISGASCDGKVTGIFMGHRHGPQFGSGAPDLSEGVPHNCKVYDSIVSGSRSSACLDAHPCGLIIYENCTAIGGDIVDIDGNPQNPAALNFGNRDMIINNLTAIGCSRILNVRADGDEVRNLQVNGLNIINGRGPIFTQNNETPVRRVDISNVRGNIDGGIAFGLGHTDYITEKVTLGNIDIEGVERLFTSEGEFSDGIYLDGVRCDAERDSSGDFVGLVETNTEYIGIRVNPGSVVPRLELNDVTLRGFNYTSQFREIMGDVIIKGGNTKENYRGFHFIGIPNGTETSPVTVCNKLVVQSHETGRLLDQDTLGIFNSNAFWSSVDNAIVNGVDLTGPNLQYIFATNLTGINASVGTVNGENFVQLNRFPERQGEVLRPLFPDAPASDISVTPPATDPTWTDGQTMADDIAARLDAAGI